MSGRPDLHIEHRADLLVGHDHGWCVLESDWRVVSEHWTYLGARLSLWRERRGGLSLPRWLFYPDGALAWAKVTAAGLAGGLLAVAWLLALGKLLDLVL